MCVRQLSFIERRRSSRRGGGEPSQAELLAAGRAVLANTERTIYVEKSAFQGAALTVKIQAEDGENDWALFLDVLLACLEKNDYRSS